MQTNPNPQKPTSTAVPEDPPAATTPTSMATRTATGKPKPTRSAMTPRSERRMTAPTGAKKAAGTKKPTAERSRTSKAAETTPKTPAAPTTRGPREGSTMWAILKVLGTATGPLSAKDIYAQIATRKLASGLKGKTPDQTVAAALAVAAKNGRHVQRTAPGTFQLREDRS